MTIGAIGSVLMGSSMPLFANVTGRMIDSYGNTATTLDSARSNMFLFLYLAIASFIIGFIMSVSWNLSAERQAAQCRK